MGQYYKSNKNKLYISLAVFLFIGFVYIITVRPIYSSSGTILIDSQDSSMSSILSISNMGLSSDLNYLE